MESQVLSSNPPYESRRFVGFWNDVYKTTPLWDVGFAQPALVELAETDELNRGSVLDVGCGTGDNALYLASKKFNVTAVDLANSAIEASKAKAIEKKLTVDFRVGNVLSLPFEDCSFDNVVDSGLFHI